MADGLWMNNGQSIIFSDTNELMDGQQRCHAIVRSGQPQSCVVVRGVPRQAFVTIDSGRRRSLADVLGMEGHKYRRQLAAAGLLAFNYAAGVAQGYTVSRGTLERFIRNHPYLADMVDQVGGAVHTTRLPHTQLSAVLFLANESRQHDTAVDSFILGLVTGANLWKSDARLTFRDWLAMRNSDPHRARGDIGSRMLFGAVGRAWNAYGAGQKLTTMKGHYYVTRETMDLYGFEQQLYHDVPDIEVKRRETAVENLNREASMKALQEINARRAAKTAAAKASSEAVH
jgi:hypothetical protein